MKEWIGTILLVNYLWLSTSVMYFPGAWDCGRKVYVTMQRSWSQNNLKRENYIIDNSLSKCCPPRPVQLPDCRNSHSMRPLSIYRIQTIRRIQHIVSIERQMKHFEGLVQKHDISGRTSLSSICPCWRESTLISLLLQTSVSDVCIYKLPKTQPQSDSSHDDGCNSRYPYYDNSLWFTCSWELSRSAFHSATLSYNYVSIYLKIIAKS